MMKIVDQNSINFTVIGFIMNSFRSRLWV